MSRGPTSNGVRSVGRTPGGVLLRRSVAGRECGREGFACGRGKRGDRNGGRTRGVGRAHCLRSARDPDHQIGRFQSEGAGCVQEVGRRKPQSGMPDRGVHEVDESSAIDVGQPRMRGDRGREAETELPIQGFQPHRAAQQLPAGVAGPAAEQGVDGVLGARGTVVGSVGSRTRH